MASLDGTLHIDTSGLALAPLPPKVAKAVSDVMAGVEKLGKDENNPHANYKYAGIEQFLEMVRPLCAKAGLIILQDEEGYEFRDSTDKYGKSLTWLVMSFAFGLAHSSGETWAHRIRRTGMVQASMGSQAFGAAQSYALKSFLRSLELIATGDSEDADSHEQNALPIKPGAKAKPKADARKDYAKIEAAFREAKTEAELIHASTVHADAVASLPDDWKNNARAEYARCLTKLRLDDEVPEGGGSELTEAEKMLTA